MVSSLAPLLDTLTKRFPGIPAEHSDAPDLHLFHAPNSICSQKVRAVLAERGIDYSSHLLNIFAGDTYDPDYVRVRMVGCRSADLRLADRHLGTTSVASSGCDACVVPTLIDAATGAVLVDSRAICVGLDTRAASGPSLIPDQLRTPIFAEMAIIDELPNYQSLAVKVVPATVPRNTFAASKVARCDALLAKHQGDPDLRAAYQAKRDKEQFAAEKLFDDAALMAARQAIVDALAGLEVRLSEASGRFLFGDTLTMADLFWGCELLRIDEMGDASMWQDNRLPLVEAYLARLSDVPSLRTAIIGFPGARMAPAGH